MAQLNLAPVPSVVAIQAVVFLVNMVIIRKLFLDPYLRLRARRDALTAGSKADANRLLFECDEIAAKVQEQIDTAAAVAASDRERIKTEAMNKRSGIISAAEEKAKNEFDSVASRIKQEVIEQRRLLPQVIERLTDEVFKLATNKH
ncbi:MAG: hypothetical protein RIQ81_445 [Pseudomonadota bacterium]|jgi:F0F1-type ATP synthase membrane subunit b/b'